MLLIVENPVARNWKKAVGVFCCYLFKITICRMHAGMLAWFGAASGCSGEFRGGLMLE